MTKGKVPRPAKKSEFDIEFASRDATSGWRDLKATTLNALADSWDFLTRTPLERTPTNYPLKGELSMVSFRGEDYERWQHKPTQGGGSRIWFFVVGKTVYLEQVHTHHPNRTK
ncbi:hypothetical protein [Schumannella sp. 10F1B-5-1]|uniref:hypothetical protein n=1 Tax=Schumannella sp. 10F1B-5-1 TaxID=2590780 RepID=UPI001130A761|nr:hypothetical protein [Schumannella sp. 10F1B-5-1]TPW72877.1 hypothetical protein FJ658_06345 [Schumannella sp. 10F1B-5-1]